MAPFGLQGAPKNPLAYVDVAPSVSAPRGDHGEPASAPHQEPREGRGRDGRCRMIPVDLGPASS
jgi:hypothetical protein